MRRHTSHVREERRAQAFFRAPHQNRPLRDGIYQFNYWIGDGGEQSKGRGLAVLRAGSVLGSDEWGGVFSGSYCVAQDGAMHEVTVDLQLPPFGELVTGHKAGPSGAGFHLSCTFDTPDPQALAVVHEGVPVAVELVYIGAVPTT